VTAPFSPVFQRPPKPLPLEIHGYTVSLNPLFPLKVLCSLPLFSFGTVLAMDLSDFLLVGGLDFFWLYDLQFPLDSPAQSFSYAHPSFSLGRVFDRLAIICVPSFLWFRGRVKIDFRLSAPQSLYAPLGFN